MSRRAIRTIAAAAVLLGGHVAACSDDSEGRSPPAPGAGSAGAGGGTSGGAAGAVGAGSPAQAGRAGASSGPACVGLGFPCDGFAADQVCVRNKVPVTCECLYVEKGREWNWTCKDR